MGKSYTLSRSILGTIEFVGWLGIVAAVLIAFFALAEQQPVGVFVSIGCVLSSFALIGLVRVGSAIFDIAENTAGLTSAAPAPGLSAAARTGESRDPWNGRSSETERTWPIGLIKVYRGHQIVGGVNRVSADDRYFDSVQEAEIYLNGIPSKSG